MTHDQLFVQAKTDGYKATLRGGDFSVSPEVAIPEGAKAYRLSLQRDNAPKIAVVFVVTDPELYEPALGEAYRAATNLDEVGA